MREEDNLLEGKAKEKPYPNNLKQCIKRAGYKIREVADEIGMPRSTLSDYVAGNRPVPKDCLDKIAKVIGYHVEEFVIRNTNQQQTLARVISGNQSDTNNEQASSKNTQVYVSGEKSVDLDEITRRQMLKAAGTALITPTHELLSTDVLDRLTRALKKPSSIDDTTLTNLEAITKNYWQLYSSPARYTVLSGLSGHLHTITQLLEDSQPTHVYSRLCSLASETTQIVGEIFFDMHDNHTAEKYYRAAIEAAKEASNRTLHAVALGRMSFIPIYNHEDGDAQRSVVLLQEAHELVPEEAPNLTQAWLAAVTAEAYSKTQDTTACLKALEASEDFIHRVQPGETSYARFSSSTLSGYKGICYIRIGRSKEAHAVLEEAISATDAKRMRHKSILLVDLATTCAQQTELKKACEYAVKALTIIAQTKSIRVMQRVLDFRNVVALWKSEPCVKSLDDQIAAVLPAIMQ